MSLVTTAGLNLWLETTQNVNILALMSRCTKDVKRAHIGQENKKLWLKEDYYDEMDTGRGFVPSTTHRGFNKGYRLVWYNPKQMPRDPTILFLKSVEVYRWEYDPLTGEVLDKIKELEGGEYGDTG